MRLDVEDRFLSHVVYVPTPGKPGETCMEWTGARVKGGYGRFRDEDGRKVLAHRWAFMRWVGRIPHGKEVDHVVCNNPPCVNPDHLRAVTALVNTRSAPHHNANKTHCKHGHPLTPDNVVMHRTIKRGKVYLFRQCKKCKRARYKPVPPPRRGVIRLQGPSR